MTAAFFRRPLRDASKKLSTSYNRLLLIARFPRRQLKIRSFGNSIDCHLSARFFRYPLRMSASQNYHSTARFPANSWKFTAAEENGLTMIPKLLWITLLTARFLRRQLEICICGSSGNLAFRVPINLELLLIVLNNKIENNQIK